MSSSAPVSQLHRPDRPSIFIIELSVHNAPNWNVGIVI